MMLTYRVRAYPTRPQHARLASYLDHTRDLYNAALQERQDCYRKTGRTLNAVAQSRELTELRKDPEYAAFPRRLSRWAINLVEAAYRGAFDRHKKGEPIGLPQFRGYRFWNTIGWDSPVDFAMRDRGLHSRKSLGGTLRLRSDRELPPFDTCKALTLSRDGDRWFANLTYEMPEPKQPRDKPKRPIGIDIGLKVLAMRSDGVPMDTPKTAPEDVAEIRRASRALSRCHRRSKRRHRVRDRLRRLHGKRQRQRQAALHRISARLTHHYDAVAVEDLNLRALTRSGSRKVQGRGSRRSWYDRAAGVLVKQIEWKCERDGRGFAEVDPRGTTIDCAQCGARVPKTLAVRVHRCMECGDIRDRDRNAAENVLARAGWSPGAAKLEIRVALSSVPGAGLAIKHGSGLSAAGPRRGGHGPPPSTTPPHTRDGPGSAGNSASGVLRAHGGWTGTPEPRRPSVPRARFGWTGQ